jgi:ATP-dependent RNA helicase DeaD
VRYVVLDEADRMLDMGFIDDVKEIFRNLPQHRQTSMFSATMPREIMSLANEFMKNPERVSVSKDEISNVMVKQFYMEVNDRDKLNQLCNILQDKKKTIVFCGAKIRVKRLAEDLHKRGFEVEAIHGDMEQPQRTRVINDFKSHKVNILIATDVVARGIDVPTVDRVISYDVPREELTYFHRIGRTARAGESGSAIIFVTNEYKREFDAIRNHTKIKIIKLSISKTPDFPIVRGAGGKSFAGARRFGQFSRSGERGFGSEKRRFDFKRDGFGHSRSGRRSSGKFRKRYNR